MNGSIRVSAKTVDDAITEALIQLGVTSDRLEYEVIEKGSAGFLGIGMKQAVIEARRKPEPKEEKVEEPVVEEPVKAEPKKVEAVQPQKAAAEKKADEPQKAAFEKAVERDKTCRSSASDNRSSRRFPQEYNESHGHGS